MSNAGDWGNRRFWKCADENPSFYQFSIYDEMSKQTIGVEHDDNNHRNRFFQPR